MQCLLSSDGHCTPLTDPPDPEPSRIGGQGDTTAPPSLYPHPALSLAEETRGRGWE